jgi:hypothetical protein
MSKYLDTRHKAPMSAIRGTADEADDRGLSSAFDPTRTPASVKNVCGIRPAPTLEPA